MIFISFVNFTRNDNILYDKILSSLNKKRGIHAIFKSLQGSKSAITMCSISIESTLLLFLLI